MADDAREKGDRQQPPADEAALSVRFKRLGERLGQVHRARPSESSPGPRPTADPSAIARGFRLSTELVAGVLVGFAGLVILSLLRGPINADDHGLFLILIATIFYGVTVNFVSYYLKGIDGFKIASVSLTVMAIPAALLMWQQNVFSIAHYDEEARFSIAIACLLGIVGSAIATALYYDLMQKAGGVFASLVTYAIPIVAMMWGLLAHEKITGIQIACLIIILVGVYIASTNSPKDSITKNADVL